MEFSSKELQYIQDQQFLLTKIEIGKKILQLLGSVEQQLQPIIKKHSWPEGVMAKSGKISKGELYLGLPYYVLDYPRSFSKEGVFAFRTMFWWGNFFSSTLQISGSYLEQKRLVLRNSISGIHSSKAYICVNESPWEHHFQPTNYLPIAKMELDRLDTMLMKSPFIKLSYCWDLQEYSKLPFLVKQAFSEMVTWLQE
ncbi:MAG: hypothetical protein DHS20C17_31530 [Cyclobacteriaceae bacterium]|nr:MAG: hypothetical protein DHS20C17_31530 [Cyclobacteriaceae bacterium]